VTGYVTDSKQAMCAYVIGPSESYINVYTNNSNNDFLCANILKDQT